jgi:hypothetical protein
MCLCVWKNIMESDGATTCVSLYFSNLSCLFLEDSIRPCKSRDQIIRDKYTHIDRVFLKYTHLDRHVTKLYVDAARWNYFSCTGLDESVLLVNGNVFCDRHGPYL